MTRDEKEIRSLIEDWAKAVRTKDMDGALAAMTRPDCSIGRVIGASLPSDRCVRASL